jgi:putative tryptophan/tyrosine transport system substrate-binding protein
MRTRREFIAGAASVVAVSRAAAEQSGKSPRLAIFSPFESAALMQANSDGYSAFFAELQRRGWTEGANLTIERYGREQNTGDLDAFAAAVARAKPDVAFTIGPGTIELKAHAGTIPLVTFTYDPIALGLTQSLAHPGANITGISVDTGPEIWGKRIGLLREILPSMSKLAFLALRAASWERFLRPAVGAACEAARVSLVPVLVDLPTSETAYRQAIATAVGDGADAIMVAENPETVASRVVITEAITAARLPAMYALREFADAGGLMAYTPSLAELNQRAASDVDAILRGTKPGDIPFYQGTKFELIINRKTATTLGLTVPPLLLVQASEVIE